ncbi:MAG: shikimate kinase, partial [Candidatus Binatia bacterium]
MPQIFRKNIALIGFMAVGKSAVGRKLARRLKRSFVDLDRFIEKDERKKIRVIFEEKGEPYFRKLEKEALIEVLRENDQVIATGGGVVTDEENLRILQQRSLLVCLRANTETLLRRAGTGKQRPLIKGEDKAKRIEELLHQREPFYADAHV